MPAQNETYPSALEALFLVTGLFILEYLLAAFLYDIQSITGMDPRDVSGVITVLANGILFSFLLYYKRLSYASLFHSSAASVRSTVTSLSVPILLIVPGLLMAISALQAILVSAFPLSSWEESLFEEMMSNRVESVVTACILAPVLEEMLFRGIILRSFLNQYQRSHAMLGSAVIFGLAHMNIYQFAVGVVIGLLLGWLYERTRSLWPCITLHVAYNSAITGIYLLSESVDESDTWEPSTGSLMAALALAIVGMSLLRRLLAQSNQTA